MAMSGNKGQHAKKGTANQFGKGHATNGNKRDEKGRKTDKGGYGRTK